MPTTPETLMGTRTIITKEEERETLDTDDIEAILIKHLGRAGWKVDFNWQVGQWVTLEVKRSRETVKTEDDSHGTFEVQL